MIAVNTTTGSDLHIEASSMTEVLVDPSECCTSTRLVLEPVSWSTNPPSHANMGGMSFLLEPPYRELLRLRNDSSLLTPASNVLTRTQIALFAADFASLICSIPHDFLLLV